MRLRRHTANPAKGSFEGKKRKDSDSRASVPNKGGICLKAHKSASASSDDSSADRAASEPPGCFQKCRQQKKENANGSKPTGMLLKKETGKEKNKQKRRKQTSKGRKETEGTKERMDR
jgi:hypothetical protein